MQPFFLLKAGYKGVCATRGEVLFSPSQARVFVSLPALESANKINPLTLTGQVNSTLTQVGVIRPYLPKQYHLSLVFALTLVLLVGVNVIQVVLLLLARWFISILSVVIGIYSNNNDLTGRTIPSKIDLVPLSHIQSPYSLCYSCFSASHVTCAVPAEQLPTSSSFNRGVYATKPYIPTTLLINPNTSNLYQLNVSLASTLFALRDSELLLSILVGETSTSWRLGREASLLLNEPLSNIKLLRTVSQNYQDVNKGPAVSSNSHPVMTVVSQPWITLLLPNARVDYIDVSWAWAVRPQKVLDI